MSFDLLFRDARLPDARPDHPAVEVGVTGGRIAAIGPALGADAAETVDCGGRLLSPGFVETHIHLDKACTIDRCACEMQRFPALAMERMSAIKPAFTVEDVHARAAATLERCLLHGTTLMRTHAEVDPGVGLRGFEGVRALIAEYAWAIDIEICVMPQEGLTNNPGTEELMRAALDSGARVVGAAPNYDTDPAAQIRRVFDLARAYDLDIDMHLDSGASAERLDTLLVCELTERFGWGGRVAIGHATRLTVLPLPDFDRVARRLADAGVAVTVLPATDLYIGGRERDHRIERSVVDANRLVRAGVTCSVATNNILNAFTPMGDGQPMRQANLYANVVQQGMPDALRETWSMVTDGAARLMRRRQYGIAVGHPADVMLVDAPDPVHALRTVAPVLGVWKGGRRTVTRLPPVLHRP